MIAKVFDFINNLLENNNLPIIIVQVLCTFIIVILCTFMSAIFSGISKAGYEMHCADSDQVFGIPFLALLVDIFMYLFLAISSIAVVFYFILKMAKDGLNSIAMGFGLKSCNTKPVNMKDIMNTIGEKIGNPDMQQYFIELNYVMNEWPIMRATFIITLSYYLSQLFLRWIEDIISSNIVLLANWQKKKTECSDEENKETKTSMDRTFILVCNIYLFVQIVIITLALLCVHIAGFTIIPRALGYIPEIYIPAVATLSVPLTYESVKNTISKVSNGQVNVEDMETKAFKALSKVTDDNGEIDFDNISKKFEGMFEGTNTFIQSPFDIMTPVTKRIISEEERKEMKERDQDALDRARRDFG
jgi:hypothetical protein